MSTDTKHNPKSGNRFSDQIVRQEKRVAGGSSHPKTYRPRRKRSGNPPAFQLTPRDIKIVGLVAARRFLSSEHIRQLVGGSRKNVTNRLKGLFEHGYLDRPQCQYDIFLTGGGSKHIAYALADKGARLLADMENGRRISWTHKNKNVGRPFLEHTLSIADFSVALDVAVQARDNIELVAGDELVASFPDETASQKKPFHLNVPLIHQGARMAVGVEPDYAFSLYLPKVKRKAFFLVEVDRGAMPIERFDLRQTSILRKLLAYQTMWKSKVHQSHFGWRNFRVLFVTTSMERVENMIASMNGHGQTQGSPLFLFADKHDLYDGDVLDSHWLDSYNNKQQLLPGKWK